MSEPYRQHAKSRPLVYGVIQSDPDESALIFVPEPEARRLAAIYDALDSKTWGEFYDKMPAADCKEIMGVLADVGELPARSNEFAQATIPGLGDGLWPTWPQQKMMEWLPEDIWQRYAAPQTSMHNGWFIEFEPRHERELIRDLRAAGFGCRHDDALIREACDCTGEGE